MSVHYKFKSAVEYNSIPVDGFTINLKDLKEAIINQKHLGKGQLKRVGKKIQGFDLKITNAETNEIYTDDQILIPKGSSLIVARVPIDPSQLKKKWENGKDSTELLLANPANLMNTPDSAEAAEVGKKVSQHIDLTKMPGTEVDKINAAFLQATLQFHPSTYLKYGNSNMSGEIPKEYKCHKCHQKGHWINKCPLDKNLRKSTGIPSMFLKEVEDSNVPGAMITAQGKFVISTQQVDMEKHRDAKGEAPVIRPAPPAELVCGLCKELLREAVLIPCCAEAYCDECIRNHLLQGACPSCENKDNELEMLVPNRYLRGKCKEFDIKGCVVLHTKSKSLPHSRNNSPTPSASLISPRAMPDKEIQQKVDDNIEKEDKQNEENKGKKRKRELTEEGLEGEYQKKKKMYETPPGIAEFNPLVPPPEAYHKTSPQHYHPPGPAQSTSHGERYMSYQSGVPPPGTSSSYHFTSRYIDQNQIVEDPLAAFNKIMQERDIERENKRRMKRCQRSRSHSRRIERQRYSHGISRSTSHGRYRAKDGGGRSPPSYIGGRPPSSMLRSTPHGQDCSPPSRGRCRPRSRSPPLHRMHPHDQVYPSSSSYSHDPSLPPRRSSSSSVTRSHKKSSPLQVRTLSPKRNRRYHRGDKY